MVQIIAADFRRDNRSAGSMISEKMMGKITDILLATVVTEIPAFLEEYAIMKNITMNNIIPGIERMSELL